MIPRKGFCPAEDLECAENIYRKGAANLTFFNQIDIGKNTLRSRIQFQSPTRAQLEICKKDASTKNYKKWKQENAEIWPKFGDARVNLCFTIWSENSPKDAAHRVESFPHIEK